MRWRRCPRKRFLQHWNLMVSYHQVITKAVTIILLSPPPPSCLLLPENGGGGFDSELIQMDVENLDGGVNPVVAADSEAADKEQRTNPFSCALWHHCIQLSCLLDQMGLASSLQHWNLDWNAGGAWLFSSFSYSSSSFSFSSSSLIGVGLFEAMKMMTEEELTAAAIAAVAAAAVPEAALQLLPQLQWRRREQ